jgi:transposase
VQHQSGSANPGGSSEQAELPASLVECHAVIQTQAQLLSAQALLLSELQAQVAVLQERINLDSNNSSKPPSSNGPGHVNRSQRRASQRKRGAQPGHKGHSRAMLDESEVDRVVDCKPEPICECGAQVQVADGPQRHQVFEVPPMRAQVDEYRLYSGRCAGCGKLHAGVLPVGVPKGQLGPRALSLVGVLGTRYHLTQRKIRNLLDQLMGLSFSVGAISQAHGKVAVALKAPVAEATSSLCTAQALWMDETHYPREGIANWVWTAVQPQLAVFAIYPSRARYVILDFIGQKCTAAVTSDRYVGYAFIDTERRQVCWAHLLRDFNRIGQRSGVAGQVGRRLLGLGLVMFRKRDKKQLDGAVLEGLQRRVHAALQRGIQQDRCSRTANTCANILKLWPALWTFTIHDALVPTNNAAEQALRSLVLKRKISGPTRSLRGDHFLARGYTAHETCLRQGVNLWDFMHKAMHAWNAKTVPPSLLPRLMPVAVAPTG